MKTCKIQCEYYEPSEADYIKRKDVIENLEFIAKRPTPTDIKTAIKVYLEVLKSD